MLEDLIMGQNYMGWADRLVPVGPLSIRAIEKELNSLHRNLKF
jgi:hypothetical protein